MNATKLRADLYSVLDQVLLSGKPVAIERNGRRLLICVDESESESDAPRKRFTWPTPRPEWVNGDVDDILDIDWSREWRP